MPKFFNKLSTQFVFSFALTASTLVIFVLGLVAFLILDRTQKLQNELTASFSETYLNDSEAILKSNLRYINLRLFNPIYEFDISLLNDELYQLKGWLKPKSILITDLTGTIITDGTEANRNYGKSIVIPEPLKDKQSYLTHNDQGQRVIFAKIGIEHKPVGYIRIVFSQEKDQILVARLQDDVNSSITKFHQALIIVGAIGLFVILIVSVLLGVKARKSFSKPIAEMTKAAKEFAAGNLNYQIPAKVQARNEVDQLSASLKQMANDISIAKNQIQQQAHFDHLTGLPNRFLSMDRLKQSIDEAKRKDEIIAVMFFDLDDFKKVNDTLGHDVGDKLLIEVANRLIQVTRLGDTVGRLGGDEFIILLADLPSMIEAQLIAEKLLEQFRSPLPIENRELLLTTSIGVALYPNDGKDPQTILQNADTAMYRAKELGRNTYSFFTKELNEKVTRRLNIEEQLHNALKKHELEIYYQPIVSLKNDKITGAEALLRWNSSEFGQVSPEEFIPIAEQLGVINEIGHFVLSHSFSQAKYWQENYFSEFTLSVNLSPLQFRSMELVNTIQGLLQKHQLKNSTINLEITEGTLITGYSHVEEALQELCDMKLNIYMDDFGTGYSSLSYLRNYPFTALKIDKSFISDITDDPSDLGLVRATIAMAHSFQMKVVAEGIETQQQLEMLKAMKCDYGQGYYFSCPVPRKEFEKLIRDQTT